MRISTGGEQDRAQDRITLPSNLVRVNEAAKRSPEMRFTTLLHHLDVEALKRAFKRQRRSAAPGVDGMTVAQYQERLEEKLEALKDRVHSGRYRPLPVRRSYIPKADGGERPLGILTLEDKIVQGALAEILSAIYEVDFLDCSYGFRPGRSAHQALNAVQKAIMTERVNFILDADIRKFFDSVDHDWLERMLAHRIADPRVLRLISLWLKAGVHERDGIAETVEGTPQGAGISPLLANIFLHYVLDLWVRQWQSRQARGQIRLIRYADDFIMTFERQDDAERMRADLAERLAKFGLQLHEDKTRLIEFGRFAQGDRRKRGDGRPETFDFLGFTHCCGKARNGRFSVKRSTQRKRRVRKLKELRQEMKRWMHEKLEEQHRKITTVLRGHYAFYGISGNYRCLARFYEEVRRSWLRALRRRGQRHHLTWQRYASVVLKAFPLPRPRLTRPWRAAMA
jgi:group II intron reverse transcriptase/maturase